MPSESAPTRDADRWAGDRDDLALFAVVLAFALLLAAPAFDYLLLGPGAGASGVPTAAVALLVALAVGAALVVSNTGERLETLLVPPAEGETVWHEVRRFGFGVAGTGFLLRLPTSVVYSSAAVPRPLAVALHQLLLVVVPLGALALLRRGGPVEYVRGKAHATGLVETVTVVDPSEADESSTDDADESSDAADWTRWDDVALFAALFFAVRFAVSSQYALLVGVESGFGVVVGGFAVVLRRAGALVPDEGEDAVAPTTDEGTERGGDGTTTGTD